MRPGFGPPKKIPRRLKKGRFPRRISAAEEKQYRLSPYGVYFQANGDLVLYNRKYQPMVGYSSRQKIIFPVRLDQWIPNIKRLEWFYPDSGEVYGWKSNRELFEEIQARWDGGEPVLPSDFLPLDFHHHDYLVSEWGETVSILTGCSRNGGPADPGKGYAKRASVGGVNLLNIPTHHHFRAVEVVDIYSLNKALTDLENEPRSCLIRGVPREPINKDQVVFRRQMVFEDARHNWVCFDIDGLPGAVTPEQVVEQVLPEVFHRVTFHYQYSNSQGFKPGTRIHLWFWMDWKVTSGNWMQWWHSHGKPALDPAVFRTVQPHITANPLLDGVADPIGGMKRSGLVDGPGYRPYAKFAYGPNPVSKHIRETGKSPLPTEEPSPSPHRNIGFIGAFNRLVPVTEILERCGYTRVGSRYLHPLSESHTPDTVINSGTHAYAFSPRNPLYEQGMDRATGELRNRNMDSFDCFRVLEHRGDELAAARDVRQMLKTEHPEDFSQARQELDQRETFTDVSGET